MRNNTQRLNAPTYSSNAAQFTFNTEGSKPTKVLLALPDTQLKEVFNDFYAAEMLIDLARFSLSERQLFEFMGQAQLRESANLRPLFIQKPIEIQKIWANQYLYESLNPLPKTEIEVPKPVIVKPKKLSDYTLNNLDLFIVKRSKALEYIANIKSKKAIICEESDIETVKNAVKDATVITYSDTSKLDVASFKNVYVLGSQNFTLYSWLNTSNAIEKLAKNTNVVLFADTPIHLGIAKRHILIDAPKFNAQVIVSDNPSATFVESILACPSEDVLFLDTHGSVNKQLIDYQRVKRTDLYFADHNKLLFVLYDNAVSVSPEALSQFKNVVFVANNETKSCVDMSTFCNETDKFISQHLEMIDKDIYKGTIEKMFFEAVKTKSLPIRRNGQTWERCPNTMAYLETQHQIKYLMSDAGALKRHLEQFAKTNVEVAEITEATAEIIADIKQSKIDLAAEKKTEFAEFLQAVENANIQSLNELKGYVAQQENMSRGGKIAYRRLETLLKVNPNFSTCFEAVRDSYVGWTKTKGRFFAAKIIKTTTKTGNALQIFRDTTEGHNYTKIDLLDIARATLPMIKGSDIEAWKQLKRICHLPNKRVRDGVNRLRLYEVIFLE
jgi:hypothetical protein